MIRNLAFGLLLLSGLSSAQAPSSEGPLGPILDQLTLRQLGPVNMSGRIMDFAVYEKDPSLFYVATASGGLWKTTNGGTTYDCVFDYGNSVSMGAVGLCQSKPDVVYVGTGEQSSRNSVAWGDGVYKSTDGGKTWKHVGLTETRHISKVFVHPKNPDIVYVAAVGRLWGRNSERGLYKSTDGGKSWKLVLNQGPEFGAIDLDVDPKNPNTLYVAMWDRLRRPYVFQSGGQSGGIYKSTDGGENWSKLTKGLPTDVGRIGMDIHKSNPKIIMATVEYRRPGSDGSSPRRNEATIFRSDTAKAAIANPAEFAKVINKLTDAEKKALEEAKKANPDEVVARTKFIDGLSKPRNEELFPYTHLSKRKIKELEALLSEREARNYKNAIETALKEKKDVEAARAKYLTTIEELRNDPYKGIPEDSQFNRGGTFISRDGGESWTLVKYINPRPFYFSTPMIDPVDPNVMYVAGMALHQSKDGGKSWNTIGEQTHADHHALWVNPKNPKQIMTGCDGGVYVSFDQGKNFRHDNKLPIGQFYAVAFDTNVPYSVYGGLQDNGSWTIPTQHPRGSILAADAINVGGGDGFYVEVDPVEPEWVYSESQGGAVGRINRKTGERRSIRPSLAGEQLRFNWNTPIHISPHDNKMIYVGSNRLMKSTDRGTTWKPISIDLTTMSPLKKSTGLLARKISLFEESTGAENHCTIVTIDESRLEAGRIATGSDDGLVNVTFDGGKTWTDITAKLPGVPANTWVSRVLWSKWKKDRLYVTLDGHRNNDFKPYVFVSEDAGKTFKSLASTLPDYDSVYAIREGEYNPNLLFLGSEMTLRVSDDLGKSWSRFRGKFPTVAVHDIRVNPTFKELVIGTHGRSIWTAEIALLEGMTSGMPTEMKVVATAPGISMAVAGGNPLDGNQDYFVPNTQPSAKVFYYLPEAIDPSKEITIKVRNKAGQEYTVQAFGGAPRAKGINRFTWNCRIQGAIAEPGEYELIFDIAGKELRAKVEVLAKKG